MSTLETEDEQVVKKIRRVIPQVDPQVEIERKRVVRRVPAKKKKNLYTLKNIAIASCAGVFFLLFGQLHLDSQISKIHYETQRLSLEISQETVKNEQLASKIAELSMYSRVVGVAGEQGLDYQDNIISIGR